MDFDCDSQSLFCATINTSNTTYLAGTVRSTLETAQVAATSILHLDENLWHRHLAHYHLHGMKLNSKQEADPICGPCLASKLNAAPFPSSTRADSLLQLIF